LHYSGCTSSLLAVFGHLNKMIVVSENG
jgi:hypothetical protein